ncbi:helix-turn-helix transcriptional regulator [Methylocystis sp. Sn-Cys]|nr:helix-turn-helix transcriptional regulator [Methylocystis sp. Sn-Cys]
MADATRLYKRAAGVEQPAPILHVGRGCAFWAGATAYLGDHQGGAPVLLAGLYGKFRLRLQGGPWLTCRAAIIPPGVSHELDFAGEPFAALYLEPNLGASGVLSPLLRNFSETNRALIGDSAEIPLFRSFYEDSSSVQWLEDALSDITMFARETSNAELIDPRLSAAVDLLHAHYADLTPVDDLARRVGLSASRFQHLFTRQIGVPFRRYRAWSRLRGVWRQVAEGASLTEAAHASGFFDSAHFAHAYRRTFGKAASDGRRIARTTQSTDDPK